MEGGKHCSKCMLIRFPRASVHRSHWQARFTEQLSGSEMLGDLPGAHSQEEGLRVPTRVCLTPALPADFTGGAGVGDEGPSCSLSLASSLLVGRL